MEDVIHAGEVGNDHFFLVLDGHGGVSAAEYVRDNLPTNLANAEGFGDMETVADALKAAFVKTHNDMAKIAHEWPKYEYEGEMYASTSGTTATLVLLREDKDGNMYVITAYVGDSYAYMFFDSKEPEILTKNKHDPNVPEEIANVKKRGGSVARWCGRVEWHLDDRRVPFLNITRALGDFWSFVPETGEYSVSPEPSVHIRKLDKDDKYLVLASDGVWNASTTEKLGCELIKCDTPPESFVTSNPAERLINFSLSEYCRVGDRADNMACIVVPISEI